MDFAVAVHGLHVASGILWAGGASTLELVVRPAMARLPPDAERQIGNVITPALGAYFAIVGTLTISLGVLQGTMFGPLTSWSAFTSPFGLTWITALALAALLAVLGAIPIGQGMRRLYANDALWYEGNQSALALTRHRLTIYGVIELAGFALVIVCMVLMSEVFS